MGAPRVGLFLDRDGVLNVNTHYPHLVEDLYLAPGVIEAFRLLKNHPDIVPVVVTNQAGVGRGYYAEFDVVIFEAVLAKRIYDQAGYELPPNRWFHCWSDDNSHPWRKPNPGMILEAAKQFNLDLRRSAMIGDKPSDYEAAVAAGIRHRFIIKPAERLDKILASWLSNFKMEC